MIEISVIVPVYNIEKYVERCINSILSQTFKDFEIIIIDDGSTDNSGLICDAFALKDKRVRVYHTTNSGVSSARNYGIRKAIGKNIAFIDGDDWIKPDYLEQLYYSLQQTDCDICICGGIEIDEQMQELKRYAYEKEEILKWNEKRLYDAPYFTYVIHRMLINSRVLSNTFFNIALSNGEDVLFITELFIRASKGVLFLPYVGYSYYIRSSGANQYRKYSKKKFSAIIAYEKRLDIMKNARVEINLNWYRSFVLEAYLLYGYIVHNPVYYDKRHADLLFGYLKKYQNYSDILGIGIKFKIKYWLMLHFQSYLEYVLRNRELPHGHIIGD